MENISLPLLSGDRPGDITINVIKEAFKLFIDTYPDFMNFLMNSAPNFEYNCSHTPVADREDLFDILRNMAVPLNGINESFSKWASIRKDSIEKLELYADMLDGHKKNKNIGQIAGSSVGIAGSVLAIAAVGAASVPTGGASVAVGAVAGTINIVAMANYTVEKKAIKSRIKAHMEEDERLTRELQQRLQDLHECIGQLGSWLERSPTLSTYITFRDIGMSAATVLSRSFSLYAAGTGTRVGTAAARAAANGVEYAAIAA